MSQDVGLNTNVGGYLLQEVLGQGMIGTVYRAGRDEREFAVKVLKPELFSGPHGAEYIERFRREAEAASWVDHPNVVKVIEHGYAGGSRTPYLVMEYVDGVSLTDLIVEYDALDFRDRTILIRQVAGALAAIHDVGLVHRDVKPCNVLISPRLQAKLTDFGIVRVPDSELTMLNQTVGTPAYMAPESFETSRTDGRADIFSLGVMTYALMTGQRPFEADNINDMMAAVCTRRPRRPRKINPKFPAQLQRIMSFMLKKDPEKRYQTMDAVKRDLDDFLRGRSRWKGLVETVAGRVGMSSNWS